MLCYFHSWNSFESFCATVTKQYLTCQLRGEDGLGRLFWLVGTTGSTEWNDAAGLGKVWSSLPTSVKQVSGSRLDASEGNTEFLQGCKTLKAGHWTSWADQALLKSEKWWCWEEGERLKASVGVCGRRGQGEVAALSVQAPWQRIHVHCPATLIKLSIRHSQSGGQGMKPSLCTRERQDQVM